MSRLNASWDAIVVGGGPAGAVAARRLAQGPAQKRTDRCRVLILEQATEAAPRIGESLPPACRPLLRDLGLLDRMDGHRPYLGNRTLWGGTVATHDFLRDPHGAGWHLDRTGFDTMLQAAAIHAGATIHRGVTVRTLTPRSGCWGMVTSLGHRLRTRLLIDATGRAAAVARRLGARRQVLDRLTGVYVVLRGETGEPSDSFSRIEAEADGWWYTAPLPDGTRVAAFHSDSDQPVLRELSSPAGFLARLRRTRMIAAEVPVDATTIVTGPVTVPAHSAATDPPAGAGWLAVGDAALALDPLSSQGLMNALFTGMTGGDAAVAMLDGIGSAGRGYTSLLSEVRQAYGANLAYFYGAEAGRRSGDFWVRRAPDPIRAAIGG
ncbi:MAG: tryptophan 7-halogenase [Thalassobaculaceae bacterium]|nr:tryptophan 7-halogenase [Thalassobaculaceae bacterium]